ncbi:hypothetical protein FA10DRAFT_267791 [Acaromyces ingoldii]|uniref:YABBY protein C-terminal domain-containing protein n=1 Tax=Acaromyces ingoldii TaxID=215250 RepID=A0A316YIF2_9BASI|nr:hypothetical protein FA10DRAFT_267791 [Acaromyces ingoldii]PWN89207.1 hypothetical protein FA10DRAFT_267791 [Acaromyces ingoldii]
MPPKKSSAAAAGGKKKSSPYNVFMKEELAKLKSDPRPHKEKFKAVAALWAKSPKNPKNAK